MKYILQKWNKIMATKCDKKQEKAKLYEFSNIRFRILLFTARIPSPMVQKFWVHQVLLYIVHEHIYTILFLAKNILMENITLA